MTKKALLLLENNLLMSLFLRLLLLLLMVRRLHVVRRLVPSGLPCDLVEVISIAYSFSASITPQNTYQTPGQRLQPSHFCSFWSFFGTVAWPPPTPYWD